MHENRSATACSDRPHRSTRRWWQLALTAVVLSSTAFGVGTGAVASGEASTKRPPACIAPEPGTTPPPPEPTTVTTVGQAYYCIFDNHFSGPTLDSRGLLVPAFGAITDELRRRGLDQPNATLPALTGRKDADWTAFSRVYDRIAAGLPDDETRVVLARVAIQAMVDSLDDNHARFASGRVNNVLGLELSFMVGPGNIDPGVTEPAHVTRIASDGPADLAGVELGDEVLAINDVPLFVNGVLTEGALKWMTDTPTGTSVKLTLHRLTTDATFTATLVAGSSPAIRRVVESKLVDGDIAYVTLPGFTPEFADHVLAAVTTLRESTELRGVILDLRGNGGGSPAAVSKLLGALAHGKVISYWCDVKDRCTPNRTDDTVELWNLPFVALTDSLCASACDAFSSAVKDLRLGTLVGARTAGAVSGPAKGYALNDHTGLLLPKFHEVAANKEIVDTIGVPPDHFAPRTAADLATGRDPGLAKATTLF